MTRILILGMVIFFSIACKEQSNRKKEKTNTSRIAANETEENIYRCGDSMMAAFKRKDWLTFVKYNNPNITKMMGGTKAFASFIDLQIKQIPDGAVKSITIGKILQVVKTLKDQQCVVEQNMQMELNGTKLDKTTYLIGESTDDGKSWTFFDASPKTSLSAKDIMPNLSSDLKIPSAKNNFQ